MEQNTNSSSPERPPTHALSAQALRVLGVLIEKELSTPDYYPMTVNGIVNGSNQKSNRSPVCDYGEITVLRALDELNHDRLAGHASVAGSRAEKYRHAAAQHWELDKAGMAILASLLLRGPQTVGELRSHTSRMNSFESMDEVVNVLEMLAQREEPLVTRVGKGSGQKGIRFAHLLAGEPTISEEDESDDSSGMDAEPERSTQATVIDDLRERLTRLESDFEAFRKQFE